jgi:Fe-S-cluster containining protein
MVGRAVRAGTAAALAAARTPPALAAVAAEAMRVAEHAFAELQQDPAVQREVAGLHCRKYCAHCCYKSVSVTPAEVFYIVAHVKATLRPKVLAKLKARLRDLDDRTRGMTPAERGRARLPCALLVGRLCSAHAARPASCRGFNSRDVRACEQALKRRDVAIPVYRPQYRIFAEAHLGLRRGLADSGLDTPHVELTAALRIALDVPDAAERWLAGEPIFKDAACLAGPGPTATS